MVPLIMLGALLLPWAGISLWRESSRHRAEQPLAGNFARILRGILVALGVLLSAFAVSVVIYLLLARRAPVVSVDTIGTNVLQNALIVQARAFSTGNRAAIAFTFEGPALQEPMSLNVTTLARDSKADVLAPDTGGLHLPPRIVEDLTSWPVIFLFPSEAIAREAQDHLRAIGQLTPTAAAQATGVLFEFRASNGHDYRATCLAGLPNRPLTAPTLVLELPETASRNASEAIPRDSGGALSSTAPERAQGDNRASAPKPASSDPAELPNQPATLRLALKHRLASAVQDDLRGLLPATATVTASADNQELLITATPADLARAGTVIAVTDWPDALKNVATGEYLADNVLRAARSFFHACATEDLAALSKLLSPQALAQLKGETASETYENYLFGAAPDAAWEASLRGEWPGKKEALQRFARQWCRYRLKRIVEDPGVAIGFGVKHFCSVAFDGAPKEFYQVTLEPDRAKGRDGKGTIFYFSTLPPWPAESGIPAVRGAPGGAEAIMPGKNADTVLDSGLPGLTRRVHDCVRPARRARSAILS
jgi:hypothetical protein